MNNYKELTKNLDYSRSDVMRQFYKAERQYRIFGRTDKVSKEFPIHVIKRLKNCKKKKIAMSAWEAECLRKDIKMMSDMLRHDFMREKYTKMFPEGTDVANIACADAENLINEIIDRNYRF